MKLKKCRICSTKFEPHNSTQVVCSPKCAYVLVQANKDKKARKRQAEDKKRLKTRSEWIKDAQKAVNEYVRVRDEKRVCISCGVIGGRMANYWDAGHYRSIGSAPHLRFYTLNIHKQCKRCNSQLSGNVVEYRIRLINRYSTSFVEAIEARQDALRPSIEYCQRLIKIMRKKIRLYKKLRTTVK